MAAGSRSLVGRSRSGEGLRSGGCEVVWGANGNGLWRVVVWT